MGSEEGNVVIYGTLSMEAKLSALAGGLKVGKSKAGCGGISGGCQGAGKVGILIGRLYSLLYNGNVLSASAPRE